MNNAEKFKQIFGLYATELWSMPESDFLEWLNRDVETTQIDHTADIGKKVSISCGQENDLISRQAAPDAFGLSEKTRKCGGDHSGYDTRMLYEIQDTLENFPAVQQEKIRCRDCKFSHMTNDGRYCKYCDQFTDDYGELVEMYFDSNFYCGYAERRTDMTHWVTHGICRITALRAVQTCERRMSHESKS